jgi:hypothetical protein
MVFTRPLKSRLRSGDQILVLHIPKTAGTTFYYFLERHFSDSEVWPIDAGPFEHQISDGSLKDIDRYKLLRSHYDYTIYRFLNRKPIYITMLRDPIERVISIYKHLYRGIENPVLKELVEQQLSLEELVRHPKARGVVEDRQVKQLAGVIQGRALDRSIKLSKQATLEIALMRLDEFAFFGLVERMDESIRLLCYTFEWPFPESYDSHNIAPSPSRREDLTATEIKAIESVNQLDLALYKHAVRLFNERIQRMEEVQPIDMSQKVVSPHKESRAAVMLPKMAPPHILRSRVVGWLGKIRRRIFPEGSELEAKYLRFREKYFGW